MAETGILTVFYFKRKKWLCCLAIKAFGRMELGVGAEREKKKGSDRSPGCSCFRSQDSLPQMSNTPHSEL
jgi:hypothetical protein